MQLVEDHSKGPLELPDDCLAGVVQALLPLSLPVPISVPPIAVHVVLLLPLQLRLLLLVPPLARPPEQQVVPHLVADRALRPLHVAARQDVRDAPQLVYFDRRPGLFLQRHQAGLLERALEHAPGVHLQAIPEHAHPVVQHAHPRGEAAARAEAPGCLGDLIVLVEGLDVLDVALEDVEEVHGACHVGLCLQGQRHDGGQAAAGGVAARRAIHVAVHGSGDVDGLPSRHVDDHKHVVVLVGVADVVAVCSAVAHETLAELVLEGPGLRRRGKTRSSHKSEQFRHP